MGTPPTSNMATSEHLIPIPSKAEHLIAIKTLNPTSATPPSYDAEPAATLSNIYWYYVLYECLAVNLVGFFTLFFQCELQSLAKLFVAHFPNVKAGNVELLFGHFWLDGDLNCSTPSAHCLTYMIAGWLFIAGVLQIFINFDGFRKKILSHFKVAADEYDCPRGIKVICMYSYFVCDWYWVVLMFHYRATIGWQQIVGSAFDILLRLAFAFKPSRMFKEN